MSESLSSSARKVQDTLQALGFPCQVVEMPHSARTAVEAAASIGCSVGQIVKSLVFKGRRTGRPILIVASGANRVNERRIAEIIGEPVEKPDADYVRERTGFTIGGVPPVGHLEKLESLVDEDLLGYQEIWAAAGTPHAVFRLTPADLVRMTQGQVVCIR